MANLIKCSVCGSDVSSEATACPKCGHNVKAEVEKAKDRQFDAILAGTAKTRKIIGAVAFVAILLAIIFMSTDYYFIDALEGDVGGGAAAIGVILSLVVLLVAGVMSIISKSKKRITITGILFAAAGIISLLSIFIGLAALPGISGIVLAIFVFRSIKQKT